MTAQTHPRRLFVSMVVSLDGYIAGPNGELDWFADQDPQFEQYADEMIDSVGLAIYGRRSYELMASYWPNAEVKPSSPTDLAFAHKMNALPKVVLSRTLEHAEWNNTTIVRDNVKERVMELKRQPDRGVGRGELGVDTRSPRSRRRVPPDHLSGGGRRRHALLQRSASSAAATAGAHDPARQPHRGAVL